MPIKPLIRHLVVFHQWVARKSGKKHEKFQPSLVSCPAERNPDLEFTVVRKSYTNKGYFIELA